MIKLPKSALTQYRPLPQHRYAAAETNAEKYSFQLSNRVGNIGLWCPVKPINMFGAKFKCMRIHLPIGHSFSNLQSWDSHAHTLPHRCERRLDFLKRCSGVSPALGFLERLAGSDTRGLASQRR